MKKQANVKKDHRSHTKIINLGSATTLTLGGSGQSYEGPWRQSARGME